MEKLKQVFRDLFHLYLYGNIHIAVCVSLFTIQSFNLFQKEYNTNYIFFTGLATSFLYAIHRLVGIDLVGKYKYKGRFGIIYNMRLTLIITAIIMVLAGWLFYMQLDTKVKLSLIWPSIISLLYVLPIFTGKRLRDLPFIKIFLIAIVYAYVCVFIPGMISNIDAYHILIFYFARLFFILAITIPFDIRDLNIDDETNVRTLVSVLGIKFSKGLAIGLLTLSFALSYIYIEISSSSLDYLYPELFVHFICSILIFKSTPSKDDSYYAFFLDGTMSLFFIIHLIMQ